MIDEIKKELISIERYDWDYDTIYQYANEHGYLNSFYEASDSVCDKIIAVNEDLEAQKLSQQNGGKFRTETDIFRFEDERDYGERSL